jgi:histidine triad (HIT) family protein
VQPKAAQEVIMAETIFTKILSGDIPSHKVYEDDLVYAFLDTGPLSPGHTLVIPKQPAATLDQLSDESAAAIGRVLPRLCRAVQKVTGCEHYNVLQNNGAPAHQAVFHVHFHIIPKPDSERGLGIDWPSRKLDPKHGAELAQRLTQEISGDTGPRLRG